jgi:hypothetical protein
MFAGDCLDDCFTPVSRHFETVISSFDLAALSETEDGIDLLERLENSGSWLQFWSKLLPPHFHYEPLREHPRYQALLKRMGLYDESVAALNTRMSFG